jgi:ABC-type phosphate transport system, permease component
MKISKAMISPSDGRSESSLLREKGLIKRFTDRYSESRGKVIIFGSAIIVIIAVVAITLFLTLQGLRSFFVDHINFWTFIRERIGIPISKKSVFRGLRIYLRFDVRYFAVGTDCHTRCHRVRHIYGGIG